MRSAHFWDSTLRIIPKKSTSQCKFGLVECKERIIIFPELYIECKLLENYVNFCSKYLFCYRYVTFFFPLVCVSIKSYYTSNLTSYHCCGVSAIGGI
jgi:hypothetical protein